MDRIRRILLKAEIVKGLAEINDLAKKAEERWDKELIIWYLWKD